MGSSSIGLDLNLRPDFPMGSTSTSATATATASAVGGLTVPPPPPKIEPKAEPIDEPLPPPPSFLRPTDTSAASSSNNFPGVFSDFNRLSEFFQSAFKRDSGETSSRPDSASGSRALVPVQNPEAHLSNVVLTQRGAKKIKPRSSELVRVLDLGPQDQRYFREVIRRTRMLYDSLRVFALAEDERRRAWTSHHRKPRADLKAAQLMREQDLWLNRDKRVVGDIPGVVIGDVFFFRMELCVLGVHGQPQAGIDYVPSNQSSNGEPIATSVIVSGGYEDDEDSGDVIVYTGHGGQDKHGRQVEHQKLESGNWALERSMNYGVEVRVVRGFRYEGSASGKIYVYDGLYRVVETWFDVGKSGCGVFKFKLVRIENQREMGSAVLKFAANLRRQPLEVRPHGYFSLDLSINKENLPVLYYNDVDQSREPLVYEYLVRTIFPPLVYCSGSNTGCICQGPCQEDCFCAIRNGGQFAYGLSGTLVRGKPLIFECGPHCRCPPTCRNRVTQKGIRHRFEVFRSRETGWGVRALDLIPAGSFICEYSGIAVTRDQVPILTMNGDSLIYPGRFTERWKEWGDLSQVFADYACPDSPLIPPLDFALDVSRMRNVACYLSHSCSPNVMVQLVLSDHNNLSFPHVMLFAVENIPPMRELSLDYGVDDDYMGKLSICN